MENLEVGRLNTFYIKGELKVGDVVASTAQAFLTDASQEQLENLLNS